MSNKAFTTVNLDVPRRIRFSNRSVQRVQTLDKPLELSDISNRKRSQAALIQWLWACLIDDDAKQIESPDDLADVLPCPLTAEKLIDMQQGLIDAFTLANPTAEKKSDTPKPSPSPESKSD